MFSSNWISSGGIKWWLFSFSFFLQLYFFKGIQSRSGGWWQPLVCLFFCLPSTLLSCPPVLDGLLVFLPHKEKVSYWLSYSAVSKVFSPPNWVFFWEGLLHFFLLSKIYLKTTKKVHAVLSSLEVFSQFRLSNSWLKFIFPWLIIWVILEMEVAFLYIAMQQKQNKTEFSLTEFLENRLDGSPNMVATTTGSSINEHLMSTYYLSGRAQASFI